MRAVRAAFREKVKENSQLSIEISNWVEDHLNHIEWEHSTIDNDVDDIFKKIYDCYDFIDCSLIVDMCEEFFHDDQERKYLVDKVNTYSKKAKAFRSSKPISELKLVLRQVYGPFRRNLKNMPFICIELHNPWNEVNISGLYLLIKKLLPKEL